jgi:hypothetical protein
MASSSGRQAAAGTGLLTSRFCGLFLWRFVIAVFGDILILCFSLCSIAIVGCFFAVLC